MDANLNGDAATDRIVLNNNGDRSLSGDITALTPVRYGATQTVAYLVTNPNAYYICRGLSIAVIPSGRSYFFSVS